MKYLVIICMLFTSCSIFKKTVKEQRQEEYKRLLKWTDSLRNLTVDSTNIHFLSGSTVVSVDSGYDKVTEEYINEYTDSTAIRRETKRVIKEKGQKRVEQSSSTTRYDSSRNMITEHSQLQEVQTEDSSATTVTTNKDIRRSTFLPWWIWLIVAVVVALGWWKRNSIIEFFT